MNENAIIECPECGATMPAAARTCFVCGFEKTPILETQTGVEEDACSQEKTIMCNGPLKLIINVNHS